MLKLEVYAETWPLREAFTISRGSRTETPVIICTLEEDGIRGWGEGQPNLRYDETQGSAIAEIQALQGAVEAGEVDRAVLQDAMKPGAARNALDCAFWDLEAKLTGKRVWDLAGLPAPKPVTTAYTLSAASPDNMAAAAVRNKDRPLIKMKLTGEGDLERVRAVRGVLPETPIIVDANEGWEVDIVDRLANALKRLQVQLVEQPLPAASDAALADIVHPLPFCADESCHISADLDHLRGRYDVINIKLDKTGGLTEALKLRQAALDAGMQIMVGCMVATSLSMAPGVLVAQDAAFVDLDGPLLLSNDRETGLFYDDNGRVHPPEAALWG
ncbi:MAG: L-Ala-D/L-Glu epimerase [Alphaproteobacteria bacterium MarineAlpha4_Bin2]|nr:MAG: L-Ala-D/L-Glu epimerase [Alphaproteobacteria bacterium MarineAlpha4_Bin2]